MDGFDRYTLFHFLLLCIYTENQPVFLFPCIYNRYFMVLLYYVTSACHSELSSIVRFLKYQKKNIKNMRASIQFHAKFLINSVYYVLMNWNEVLRNGVSLLFLNRKNSNVTLQQTVTSTYIKSYPSERGYSDSQRVYWKVCWLLSSWLALVLRNTHRTRDTLFFIARHISLSQVSIETFLQNNRLSLRSEKDLKLSIFIENLSRILVLFGTVGKP